MKHLSERTVITGLMGFQFVALLLIAFLTLNYFRLQHLTDLKLYYNFSLSLMQGQFPYRDFPLEYPPLALLPIVLPQLFNPFGFRGYVVLFFVENALFCILVAWVLWRIASSLRFRHRSMQVLVSYVLLVIVSAPLLPWRYDLFPALLTLLALLSVVAGHPVLVGDQRSFKRLYTRETGFPRTLQNQFSGLLVGFWLGLGIAAKLYPVVLLPIFSLYYLVKREYLTLLRVILGTFVTTGLILLPFALVGSERFLSFLKYHQHRGLQLESLSSGLILLINKLGGTEVQLINNYGAAHLISPLADNVLKWLPFTFLFMFGVVIFSCFNCFRREQARLGTVTTESLVAYVTVTLLIFIATNKVFSPQYIIWLLPFAPLLRLRQIGLFIVICIATFLIFPFFYWKLINLDLDLILLLNLRNILLVTLMFWLLGERSIASAEKKG
jgi:hypothetical protein